MVQMNDKLKNTVNQNNRLKELATQRIEKRNLDALEAELYREHISKENVGATFNQMMVMSGIEGPISRENEKQYTQLIFSKNSN